MGGPTYADVAASIGSTMDGSSFSGLLTRDELATSALGRPGTVAFVIDDGSVQTVGGAHDGLRAAGPKLMANPRDART